MASQTRKLIFKLVSLVIVMFVFAVWVMPPIYTLFCEVTGLNGKTRGQYVPASSLVDETRWVEVQFVATNSTAMPWDFEPETFSIKVRPGKATVTRFLAGNPTAKIMVGQAIPSIAPSSASAYFLKTECFCFEQQALGPQEKAELGLHFIVDQSLPKAIKTITLSYTLFDVTKNMPELVESKAKELAAES